MQVPGLSHWLAQVTKCKRDFLLNSREASFTTHLGFALRTPESHTAVTHSESHIQSLLLGEVSAGGPGVGGGRGPGGKSP